MVRVKPLNAPTATEADAPGKTFNAVYLALSRQAA